MIWVVYILMTSIIFACGQDRYNVSLQGNVWDKEYSEGTWKYLVVTPLEIGRVALLYSSFYLPFAKNHHLLDVGCGEGEGKTTLYDQFGP